MSGFTLGLNMTPGIPAHNVAAIIPSIITEAIQRVSLNIRLICEHGEKRKHELAMEVRDPKE